MKAAESSPDARPPIWPRGPIPAGTYRARLVGLYLDDFSQNPILALTFQVEEGRCRGRRVFDWLWPSADEEAAAMGPGKFSALARSMGLGAPESVASCEELLERVCLMEVSLMELEDGPANEVTGYSPLAPPLNDSLPWPAVA